MICRFFLNILGQACSVILCYTPRHKYWRRRASDGPAFSIDKYLIIFISKYQQNYNIIGPSYHWSPPGQYVMYIEAFPVQLCSSHLIPDNHSVTRNSMHIWYFLTNLSKVIYIFNCLGFRCEIINIDILSQFTAKLQNPMMNGK